MTSGSIYIDPDGVSSVSSQMLKTADEIDALRQRIVPQVYNAVEMSYPSLNILPQVGPSVGSAHENIGYFAYEAETVAHELRTSAYVLNQVANEGRLMMEQLLQQSTLFMGPGGSGGTFGSVDSWITQVEKTLGVSWNTASQIVWSILQSDQFKQGADIVGSLVGLFGPAGLLGAGIGTIFDIASNGDWNLRKASGDIIGGGIGLGVDIGVQFIPGAGEVYDGLLAASIVNHLEATGMSWGQRLIAQGFSGNVKGQLLDSSKNWNLVAQNSSISPVYDSLGLAVTDIGIGIATGNFSHVPGDFGDAGLNAGRFALSFGQMKVNTDTTVVNDGLALGDKMIQISPLPQSFKNATNSTVGDMMQGVNSVADLVTQPNDVVNAWNWTKGLF
ncbi:MAG TPA: hypothetical protein VNG51_15240 [Ktedonobacteraceae bacterium]|nr:hypothetical protein [Ktedonobacteraceae bacterium]